MNTREMADRNRRDREIDAVLGDLVGGVQSGLGHVYERGDQPDKALPLFEAEVARQPGDAQSWYNLGDTLLALGKYDEARQALEKASELAPGAWIVAYDLGLAYYQLGLPEKAAEIFGVMTQVDPELRRAPSHIGLAALTNRALCFGELGFWGQATATLKPALRLVTDVLINLGRFSFREGSPQEAFNYFQMAVNMAPGAEDALHGAGSALLQLKKWREAESYLARAVKANRDCQDAWYDLGVSLAKQRKSKLRTAARRCFSTVLKLNPKHAWSEYDLACLDALAGKPAPAFRHLERALDLGLNDTHHVLGDADLISLRRDKRWKLLASRLKGRRD